MLCALTVRRVRSGTFDEFREAFMRNDDPDNPPDGWVRFNMIRNVENPAEAICFGFFDGTVEELRHSAGEEGYAEQLEAIAPYVESVVADGLYEIIEEYTAAPVGGLGADEEQSTRAQGLFEAYREAMQSHDYQAVGELFADDAVAVTYSERCRPSSAKQIEGKDAIVAVLSQGPDDLDHKITDEAVADDRFAFTLTCRYATGELVVATYICELRAGKIGRQIAVEAWDE